ncbi:CoA-transferase subunit beta [Kutzneria buriramensis]|uniref:Acyl CoA:acetate/3-ketoacid CoA transferase beta subunit n=1 Tax=Kutzneria buriramensis TaxID=1045776 RepID=A0A3E0GWK7_9PSEU|nr:CoA-transferase [Kutzneria buriramensis]REH28515.1 acyl CoA:acetate/3-ketoacid CoA transferase beta subunit [Kutzneria buriramensis]
MSRIDVCVAACADLFLGAGEILASPMGLIPQLGAKLARLTTEPDLLLSDGEAYLLGEHGVEGWLPYRKVFDVVAHGRRHVVMGANQLDRFGNQNISAIGDHDKPTRQLLGFRGAPGNTVNHRTSYWVPKHSRRVFVPRVDVVSGVGHDRGFHHAYRVVTNLCVLDFETPDGSMRLVSTHPGVTVDEVLDNTGFPLDIGETATTREPSRQELELIDKLDPDHARD